MKNHANEMGNSILSDISMNEEGKDILMENYILLEKLENFQKLYENEKFEDSEKIKQLENKVFHLKSSLQNANETIEVLKNVDNKENGKIKEMIEKMQQKINDLDNFNKSIKKENVELSSQLDKLKISNNNQNNLKENINNLEEINFTKKNTNNDNNSYNSNYNFAKKTPEEIKNCFKALKNEKDTFYENAVNIITENEIEIESFKGVVEDYKNLIKIYEVKYNLLKNILKKNYNINLPNLEDFEEDMIKTQKTSLECDSMITDEYNSHFFENLKTTKNTNSTRTIKKNVNFSQEILYSNEKEDLINNGNFINFQNNSSSKQINFNQNNKKSMQSIFSKGVEVSRCREFDEDIEFYNRTFEHEINEYRILIDILENKLSESQKKNEEKIEKLQMTIENIEFEKKSLAQEIEKIELNKKNFVNDIEYYTQTARNIQDQKEKLEDVLRNNIDHLKYEKKNLEQTNLRLVETNQILEKEIKDIRQKNNKTIALLKEQQLKEKTNLTQKCKDLSDRYFDSNKAKEFLHRENQNLKQVIEKQTSENVYLENKRKRYKEKKKDLIDNMNEKFKIHIEKVEESYTKNIEDYQNKINSLKSVIENKVDKISNVIDKIKAIKPINENADLYSTEEIKDIQKSSKKIENIQNSFKEIYDVINNNNKLNNFDKKLNISNFKKNINNDDEEKLNEFNNNNNNEENSIEVKDEDVSILYGIDLEKKNPVSNYYSTLNNFSSEFTNNLININEIEIMTTEKSENNEEIIKNSEKETKKCDQRVSLQFALNNDEIENLENKIKKFNKGNTIRNNSNREKIKKNVKRKLIKEKNDNNMDTENSKEMDIALENEMLKKEISLLKEKKDEFKTLDNLLEIKNLKEKNLILSQENKILLKEIDLLKIDLENLEISKADYINKLNKDLDKTKDIAAKARFALGQISFDKDLESLKLKNSLKKIKKIITSNNNEKLLHRNSLPTFSNRKSEDVYNNSKIKSLFDKVKSGMEYFTNK